MNRDVKGFVKSRCLRGYTDAQVTAVARQTHWNSHMDEIRDWLRRKGNKWRSKHDKD